MSAIALTASLTPALVPGHLAASGDPFAVRGERFTVAEEAGPRSLATVLTEDLARVLASQS